MCKGCAAAATYQMSTRAYDDPHPADLVENPRHKWKFYMREVHLRRKNFAAHRQRGEEALNVVAEKRQALGTTPTIEAQREVFEAYEQVQYLHLIGVHMSSIDLTEALAEANFGQIEVAPHVTRVSLARAQARTEAFERAEELVEEQDGAFRRRVDELAEELKTALPDYDAIAPKWVSVSGPAF